MGKQRDARLRASVRATESENVVLLRPRRESASDAAPPVALTNAERPAPSSSNDERAWLLFLLLGSLLLHGGLLALFRQEPEPYLSVGIPAISVEIMLGADTPAGVGQTPIPHETQETEPTEEEIKPVETPAQDAERKQPEEPVQEVEAEPVKEELPEAKGDLVPPQAEPEQPVAKAVTEPPPVQPKPEPKQQPKETKQQPKETKQQPKETMEETKRTAEKAKQPPPPRRNAQAPKGFGIGRSSADANYHGLVAAHLARHKQLGQRAEGRPSITFAIDGSGHVTSVRLARSSGAAALDQESIAMVRRASPFPAPPGGQPMSFTVPVRFDVR